MSLTKLGLRDFKQPKVFVTPKIFFKKEGKWDTLLASTPVDGCDVKEKAPLSHFFVDRRAICIP